MGLKKNLIYNAIYQIIIVILPFITIPYISRVLGTKGIGIYSFTDSVTHYFILTSVLGVNLYGSRAIAYVKDNKLEMSKTFMSIFYIKIFTTFVSWLVFCVFVFTKTQEYKMFYLIGMINFATVAVDISWLITGLEKIKTILFRNLLMRALSIVLIFTLVKDVNDLWIYILIILTTAFVGQILLWIEVPKFIYRVRVNFEDIKTHFRPIVTLFLLQVATEIYLYLDKTMLGVLSTTTEVGIYEMAQKLVRLVLTLVTSTTVVMIPRISNLFVKKDFLKIKEYISKMFVMTNFITVPMIFGLCGIISEFVPWFFGTEFNNVIVLVYVIAPILIIIPWGNIIGVQLMIPMGKEKLVTISPVAGAITNIILNVILIQRFKAIGASIASVFAELIGMLITIFMMRKFLPFRSMFKGIHKNVVASLVMFVVIRVIGISIGIGFITTLVQIFVGIIVYLSIQYILKNDIVFEILQKISNFISRGTF
ncbi:oligosaccharide flippase family protein [Clostridium sp. DL1XJH146]